jgi:serine/alanine adding enzyme
MSYIVTDKYSEIDLLKWGEFVHAHPKGTVFQTPEMYECYLHSGGCPHVIVVMENKNIVGILLSVLLKEKGRFKGYLSSRSIIIGGPIVLNDNKHIVEILLSEYDVYINGKVIYTQIRNLSEQLNNCDIYRNHGYIYKPHLNFIIKLDTEKNIWERIGKGRLKQIKKAQKNNLYVDVYQGDDITEELVAQGYRIIKDVYSRANLPLTNIMLIQEANKQGLLVLFVVRNSQGEMLGCRFGLRFNNTMYGWYAGSYVKYYKLFPNDILIWETLKWCCLNGYRTFDYGGAGNPNEAYGVRDFKSQMGGMLVNYGRFEKCHKQLIMCIAKIGYKVYRTIFKL